jgi:hypothetical protein
MGADSLFGVPFILVASFSWGADPEFLCVLLFLVVGLVRYTFLQRGMGS